MQLLESKCDVLNNTKFPAFMGERFYMVKFFKSQGLPDKLHRFQDTVDAMLQNVNTMVDDVEQPIFITADEKYIKAGCTHRRSGAHIDGYWEEALCAHDTGRHLMYRSGRWNDGSGRWNDKSDFSHPESIILASSVAASMGWIGKYHNDIGKGGDCSHLDLSGLESFILQPDTVYRGNVTFIHESIPLKEDTERTLIRLNVKNC